VLRGVPANIRSDLWSLGAIFYECLVGRPLVSNSTSKIKGVRAFSASSVIFPQETLEWIPESMRVIIGRLCDSHPEERFKNASEAIEMLKAYCQARRRCRRAPRRHLTVSWKACRRPCAK